MLPQFPHTNVMTVPHWSNYHGTVRSAVPIYCTPDTMSSAGDSTPRRLARHGQALKAILEYCFTQNPPAQLRVLGARWSLSNILEPHDVVLDPANLNITLTLREEWLTPDYRAIRRPHGFVPVFVQGGTHISTLNRRLGQSGLALQTSGASDGHRIAGCIATGTHGSAMGIGALHDTVLALHLLVSPDKSVLLQAQTAPACTDDVAAWLEQETGLSTTSVRDDRLFAAAQVSLGSLGIVHGVIVEATPLYRLRPRRVVGRLQDTALWHALTTLETQALHPDIAERPFHFEAVLHPYPPRLLPGMFMTLLWKESATDIPFAGPMPVRPEISSEAMGLIGLLGELADSPLSTVLVRAALSKTLGSRYKAGDGEPAFPSDLFGPSSTPAGHGTSTEIVVAHTDTHATVDTIYRVLRTEARRGNHLLGPVALRFVPQTNALLGMNIHPMNCYIELPSVRNQEVEVLYQACWDALAQQGIAFTCHWGQRLRLDRAQLEHYFGPRVQHWLDARAALLDKTGMAVFASPLLASVGLDQ